MPEANSDQETTTAPRASTPKQQHQSQTSLAPPTATSTTTAAAGATAAADTAQQSSDDWLLIRVGSVPKSSLGWFRCGVGFFNRKEFIKSIECFQKSLQLDPMNYNAYQIMARACIAVNRASLYIIIVFRMMYFMIFNVMMNLIPLGKAGAKQSRP
jgi:hypothetical protein